MKDYKLVEVRKGGVSITLVRRRGYHSIKEARRDYKEYARHRYQRGQRKRKYVIEFTEELLEPLLEPEVGEDPDFDEVF